ncbi:DEAD/DEAH box helicase [Candidatus Woesearchaeota archaeon]|nr:DEAD/DEAH box helicase [Candidatus Woesearchaeota archaeon]
MIKNFKPRLYQETILATASLKNTLVVLPTGLGKTNIFIMLAAQRLKQYPKSKILLVGPTKPLIDQYSLAFGKFFDLDEKDMAIFTGAIAPEERKKVWEKSKIIFSTPQSIENDIISKRISLENVSLLGIDEAHRAVSNYSYVWVAKQYNTQAKFPLIIGLTASPGSEMEKITEVCKNLFIEEIEVRTETDPDVSPYVQETEINWVEVELTKELKQIKRLLEEISKERLQKLKNWGILQKNLRYINKMDLLLMQTDLHKQATQERNNFTLWHSISLVAEIIKIQHALELLETQGISQLSLYLKKLKSQSITTKIKAVKNLVIDVNFKSAFILTERLINQKIEHPKLKKLSEITAEELSTGKKILIFTQYRHSASKIAEELNKIKSAKANIFVGQLKKENTGLSQKEQKQILDDFRADKFNILVATSIAEEGLDIPKVDLVIFYEPIPSAIRHIQRSGRTGRHKKGKVIILLTKDTRDIAFRWSAHHKQKKMYNIINKLKDKINSPLLRREQSTIKEFIPKSDVLVFADHRERNSAITKILIEKGIEIKLDQLKTADYLCSSRVAIELKSIPDFVNSIIDGRLLEQLKQLKENFDIPIIILQGEEDIYSVRKVHPAAIQGMLATIAVSYNIPLLQTKDEKETASLIYTIARREQETNKGAFTPHSNKKAFSLKEQQEYIVSSLPDIGMTLAKPLLKKFKTIKNLVNAKASKLTEVEKIGKIKAKKIRDVLDTEYED